MIHNQLKDLVTDQRWFRVIYSDPPWNFPNRNKHTKFGLGASRYKRLKTSDIAGLPVREVSDPSSSILFLWSPASFIDDAIQKVIPAWGFKFVTVGFVWHKVNRDGSSFKGPPGNYTMSNCEFCLIGRRGKTLPRVRRNISQVCTTFHPRLLGIQHSEKPVEIRRRIERLYGRVPRLEMFARRTTGADNFWTFIGDQVGILDDQKGWTD